MHCASICTGCLGYLGLSIILFIETVKPSGASEMWLIAFHFWVLLCIYIFGKVMEEDIDLIDEMTFAFGKFGDV